MGTAHAATVVCSPQVPVSTVLTLTVPMQVFDQRDIEPRDRFFHDSIFYLQHIILHSTLRAHLLSTVSRPNPIRGSRRRGWLGDGVTGLSGSIMMSVIERTPRSTRSNLYQKSLKPFNLATLHQQNDGCCGAVGEFSTHDQVPVQLCYCDVSLWCCGAVQWPRI